jgi:endoglucanase
MKKLIIILIIAFILSLLLTFISFDSKMTAIQLVKNMGLGYNFANTFECYNRFQEIRTPEEQITLWGNAVPTKKMIKSLKKYGFKTIRLPITWINFIDNKGNIDSNCILYIKKVIDFVVKDYNMYCIINIHNDCKDDNWLSKGINAKNKFIKLFKIKITKNEKFIHNTNNHFHNFNNIISSFI